MTSKITLNDLKYENKSSRNPKSKLNSEINFNLKNFLEGMQEWLDAKELSGDKEIPFHRAELEYEIETQTKKANSHNEAIKNIQRKMNQINLDTELLKEFKGIFNPRKLNLELTNIKN